MTLLMYTIVEIYLVCESEGLYLTCFFPNNEKWTYRLGFRRISSRRSWICALVCSSVDDFHGAVVSCEEHNFLGGLGESISRTLAIHQPTPQEFVATQDTFGESGTPAQLMEKYGLDANSIINATKQVIARKK